MIRNDLRPTAVQPSPLTPVQLASSAPAQPKPDRFDVAPRRPVDEWVAVSDPTLTLKLEELAEKEPGEVIVRHPDNIQTKYELDGRTYVCVIGIAGPSQAQWFEVREGSASRAELTPPPPGPVWNPQFPRATQSAFAAGTAHAVDAQTAAEVRRDGAWAGATRMFLPVPIFTMDGATSVNFIVKDGVLYADVTQSGPTDAAYQQLYRIGNVSDLEDPTTTERGTTGVSGTTGVTDREMPKEERARIEAAIAEIDRRVGSLTLDKIMALSELSFPGATPEQKAKAQAKLDVIEVQLKALNAKKGELLLQLILDGDITTFPMPMPGL